MGFLYIVLHVGAHAAHHLHALHGWEIWHIHARVWGVAKPVPLGVKP